MKIRKFVKRFIIDHNIKSAMKYAGLDGTVVINTGRNVIDAGFDCSGKENQILLMGGYPSQTAISSSMG